MLFIVLKPSNRVIELERDCEAPLERKVIGLSSRTGCP
jgi:hypothetical protein